MGLDQCSGPGQMKVNGPDQREDYRGTFVVIQLNGGCREISHRIWRVPAPLLIGPITSTYYSM